MQTHSQPLPRVRNLMQPKLIRHISDFIFPVSRLLNNFRRHQTALGTMIGIRIMVRIEAGEGEARLAEGAFEDFHQAVGVGMVVDGRAAVGGPH